MPAAVSAPRWQGCWGVTRCIDLALVDVRRDALEALARELDTEGCAVEIMPADLSVAGECEQLVPAVLATFGRVDILVNAAAVLARRELDGVTPAYMSQVFQTNTWPVFLLSRAVMRDMETRGWGRIVNVTSTGVYEGGFTMTSAIYEASKGAIAVLTKMFAKHGASRGILVNSVCPGGMRTRMLLEETPPELVERTERDVIPLGRLAEPIEVAYVIAWLVSDEAFVRHGRRVRHHRRPCAALRGRPDSRRYVAETGHAGGRSATVSQPAGCALSLPDRVGDHRRGAHLRIDARLDSQVHVTGLAVHDYLFSGRKSRCNGVDVADEQRVEPGAAFGDRDVTLTEACRLPGQDVERGRLRALRPRWDGWSAGFPIWRRPSGARLSAWTAEIRYGR